MHIEKRAVSIEDGILRALAIGYISLISALHSMRMPRSVDCDAGHAHGAVPARARSVPVSPEGWSWYSLMCMLVMKSLWLSPFTSFSNDPL